MSDAFIEDLNIARHLANTPFIINSGVRCPAHNKRVGGLPSSSHQLGLAVDIKANDSESRFKIMQGLIQVGFTRIGIHKTFIHVDIDRTKPVNLIWLYR